MKRWILCGLMAAMAILHTGCAMFNTVSNHEAQGISDVVRKIDVRGKSERIVEPDEINWSLSVVDQDPELAAAMASNEDRTADLLNLIRGMGIEPRDIKTHSLNLHKVYERLPEGNQGPFRHYEVRRHIDFKQTDMSRYGEFLEKMVALGGAEASHSFGYSKQIEVTEEVRLEAVKAARNKAEAMADLAGMTLGPAIQISEYRDDDRISRGSYAVNNVSFYSGSGASPQGASFAAGSMSISWEIYATFEMLPLFAGLE